MADRSSNLTFWDIDVSAISAAQDESLQLLKRPRWTEAFTQEHEAAKEVQEAKQQPPVESAWMRNFRAEWACAFAEELSDIQNVETGFRHEIELDQHQAWYYDLVGSIKQSLNQVVRLETWRLEKSEVEARYQEEEAEKFCRKNLAKTSYKRLRLMAQLGLAEASWVSSKSPQKEWEPNLDDHIISPMKDAPSRVHPHWIFTEEERVLIGKLMWTEHQERRFLELDWGRHHCRLEETMRRKSVSHGEMASRASLSIMKLLHTEGHHRISNTMEEAVGLEAILREMISDSAEKVCCYLLTSLTAMDERQHRAAIHMSWQREVHIITEIVLAIRHSTAIPEDFIKAQSISLISSLTPSCSAIVAKPLMDMYVHPIEDSFWEAHTSKIDLIRDDLLSAIITTEATMRGSIDAEWRGQIAEWNSELVKDRYAIVLISEQRSRAEVSRQERDHRFVFAMNKILMSEISHRQQLCGIEHAMHVHIGHVKGVYETTRFEYDGRKCIQQLELNAWTFQLGPLTERQEELGRMLLMNEERAEYQALSDQRIASFRDFVSFTESSLASNPEVTGAASKWMASLGQVTALDIEHTLPDLEIMMSQDQTQRAVSRLSKVQLATERIPMQTSSYIVPGLRKRPSVPWAPFYTAPMSVAAFVTLLPSNPFNLPFSQDDIQGLMEDAAVATVAALKAEATNSSQADPNTGPLELSPEELFCLYIYIFDMPSSRHGHAAADGLGSPQIRNLMQDALTHQRPDHIEFWKPLIWHVDLCLSKLPLHDGKCYAQAQLPDHEVTGISSGTAPRGWLGFTRMATSMEEAMPKATLGSEEREPLTFTRYDCVMVQDAKRRSLSPDSTHMLNDSACSSKLPGSPAKAITAKTLIVSCSAQGRSLRGLGVMEGACVIFRPGTLFQAVSEILSHSELGDMLGLGYHLLQMEEIPISNSQGPNIQAGGRFKGHMRGMLQEAIRMQERESLHVKRKGCDSFTTERDTIFCDRIQRPIQFVDIQGLVERVTTVLAEKGKLVLCGPGGSGKTCLGMEMASRLRAQFRVVWWVNADSVSSLVRGFTQLYSELNGGRPTYGMDFETELLPAVWKALDAGSRSVGGTPTRTPSPSLSAGGNPTPDRNRSPVPQRKDPAGDSRDGTPINRRGSPSRKDPQAPSLNSTLNFNTQWLLIYDNANSRKILDNYPPPPALRGSVVILSRVAHWPKFHVEKLAPLSLSECSTILQKITSIPDSRGSMALSKCYAGNPQVIRMVGASMVARGMDFKAYLRCMFSSSLLQSPLTQLVAMALKRSCLLAIVSYLGSEIPLEVMQSVVYQVFYRLSCSTQDVEALQQELCTLCIIRKTENSIQIQETVRKHVDRLSSANGPSTVLQELVNRLDQVYTFDTLDPGSWITAATLHPHAKELLRRVRNFELNNHQSLVSLLTKVGHYDLIGWGLPTESLSLLDRALEIAQPEDGIREPHQLGHPPRDTALLLATIYAGMGNAWAFLNYPFRAVVEYEMAITTAGALRVGDSVFCGSTHYKCGRAYLQWIAQPAQSDEETNEREAKKKKAEDHFREGLACLTKHLPDMALDTWIMPLCPPWSPMAEDDIGLASCIHTALAEMSLEQYNPGLAMQHSITSLKLAALLDHGVSCAILPSFRVLEQVASNYPKTMSYAVGSLPLMNLGGSALLSADKAEGISIMVNLQSCPSVDFTDAGREPKSIDINQPYTDVCLDICLDVPDYQKWHDIISAEFVHPVNNIIHQSISKSALAILRLYVASEEEKDTRFAIEKEILAVRAHQFNAFSFRQSGEILFQSQYLPNDDLLHNEEQQHRLELEAAQLHGVVGLIKKMQFYANQLEDRKPEEIWNPDTMLTMIAKDICAVSASRTSARSHKNHTHVRHALQSSRHCLGSCSICIVGTPSYRCDKGCFFAVCKECWGRGECAHLPLENILIFMLELDHRSTSADQWAVEKEYSERFDASVKVHTLGKAFVVEVLGSSTTALLEFVQAPFLPPSLQDTLVGDIQALHCGLRFALAPKKASKKLSAEQAEEQINKLYTTPLQDKKEAITQQAEKAASDAVKARGKRLTKTAQSKLTHRLAEEDVRHRLDSADRFSAARSAQTSLELTPVASEILSTTKTLSPCPSPKRKREMFRSKIKKLKPRKRAASVNAAKQNCELHQAVSRGSLPGVQQLLEEGAIVDARDRNQLTPLIRAINQGDLRMVKQLIQTKANVNVHCGADTPLRCAVAGGFCQVTEELVKHGAALDQAVISKALCQDFDIFVDGLRVLFPLEEKFRCQTESDNQALDLDLHCLPAAATGSIASSTDDALAPVGVADIEERNSVQSLDMIFGLECGQKLKSSHWTERASCVRAITLRLKQEAPLSVSSIQAVYPCCAYLTSHGRGFQDAVEKASLECMALADTLFDYLTKHKATDGDFSLSVFISKLAPTLASRACELGRRTREASQQLLLKIVKSQPLAVRSIMDWMLTEDTQGTDPRKLVHYMNFMHQLLSDVHITYPNIQSGLMLKIIMETVITPHLHSASAEVRSMARSMGPLVTSLRILQLDTEKQTEKKTPTLT